MLDQNTLWDEMLDEFRALGGTADNVCLKEGRFGRGLFPRDPSRPFKVHIPESLLVSSEHVQFDNGVFRIGPAARIGEREKAFIESYEQNFSWGVGQQDIEELLQMMQDCPSELQELLKRNCSRIARWFAGPAPEVIQTQFLVARRLNYNGRSVIIPIVELVNHGQSCAFETENGVGLSGAVADEVLACYHTGDSWQIFVGWGFASAENFAFSLPLTFPDLRLDIEGHDPKFDKTRKSFYPDVTLRDDRLNLSYLMLGHKRKPRMSRGIFSRIMADAGREKADETFDFILHVNRMRFYKLIEVAEQAPSPLRRLLQTVSRYQLEAISHSFGTREV